MTLDIPTLIVVTVLISMMASGVLLFSWLQNRNVTALAWWALAYVTGALAATFLGTRDSLLDFWSINIGNALLLATAGAMWCGVRSFDERPVSAFHLLCGPLIWLGACCFEDFYHSLHARIALASAIVAAYSALSAWELWRSRQDGLVCRWPAMGLFATHAAIYLLRIPLTAAMVFPPGATLLQSKWLAYGILEALAHAFATSFILVAMAKERVESRHKRAAVIDALTDVPNRRGFIELAETVVGECRDAQRPVTLLLFDLDHFKSVNDTFGHQAGDTILRAFCRAVQSRLGPNDLFGRLGGEEFVCLAPVPLYAALDLAERIRTDFDASIWAVEQEHIHATVSVGVATSSDVGHDLEHLLASSDKALYRAKAKGRNRVECPRPALTLLPAVASG